LKTDTLTRRQINRATLARQMLLAREQAGAATAVERLCGMQAQEARPPFIGLWTRVAGFHRQDLHAALHRRDVVRATLRDRAILSCPRLARADDVVPLAVEGVALDPNLV